MVSAGLVVLLTQFFNRVRFTFSSFQCQVKRAAEQRVLLFNGFDAFLNGFPEFEPGTPFSLLIRFSYRLQLSLFEFSNSLLRFS